MENKTIAENTYDALATMMHQGKSIEQWAKDFKGEFTMPQLVKMAKCGCDFQKMLLQQNGVLSVDEAAEEEKKDETTNESSAEDEDAALNEEDGIKIENVSDLIDELNDATNAPNSTSILVSDLNGNNLEISEVVATPKAIVLKTQEAELLEKSNEEVNEATYEPEDVVTVGDFISLLERRTDANDKITFRCNKKDCILFDVGSKGGIAVVDLVYGKQQFNEKDDEQVSERAYNSRTGGYGGTGKSFASYEYGAPRGKSIGWYAVDQIDPKAKGKMYGWRMGPSNFPFEDLLYPERKYKVGTTVMRNKYVKAGSESGIKYIAIPSYFSAIKNNDQEAINLLNALGIPLDLTFGMDPNDDYSVTYTIKN